VLERDTAFVRAYNKRQLVLVNWVYAYLPKLSRSTLKAKQKLRREAESISALGGNYGHRRGAGRIDSDPDLPAAIETCLAAGGKHWGASQIYDILQLEFGLNPKQPSTICVYSSDRLTEFVCQAVWREAADIDLADIANRARHLYEILLRSVNQIRKRGKTLLRKLASDPYLLVGKTAQELTEVFQSKLHDYPAIQSITAAITESESRPEACASSNDDREPPAMELERYHQELQRLEAESQRQLLLQEQRQSRQYRVEELINCWQQQQARPVVEASELELLMQHLSLPEGRGFLAAVTSSSQEERQFFDWLMGRITSQLTVVDRRPLLQDALARWRERQNLSAEDKQSLLYYIQEPEGLGVLKAYTSPDQEQQFQSWLIEKF
jgi:putative transposase